MSHRFCANPTGDMEASRDAHSSQISPGGLARDNSSACETGLLQFAASDCCEQEQKRQPERERERERRQNVSTVDRSRLLNEMEEMTGILSAVCVIGGP